MVHLLCWQFFGAVMPRCGVRVSKEQANFALGQRVIKGEVSVTSDSDPLEHGGELRYHYHSDRLR